MIKAGSRSVTVVVLAVIAVVLVTFLAITLMRGDETNDLENNQPSPSPASSSPS
ncbi:MAG: hypothetical protein JWN22_990 [Nocardioides sp.]|nr:hypothetical protein [Nocardioides sp.]